VASFGKAAKSLLHRYSPIKKGNEHRVTLSLVQARNFFVQFLGQTIGADLVGGAVGPEVELREALIGEAWCRRMGFNQTNP
jgi:hypothetical protein